MRRTCRSSPPHGSGPDSTIRVRAVLPPELKFVRAGGATAVTADGQNLTFAPLPSLASGATATWTVEVTATKAGDARFAIDMISDTMTEPAVETEPTKLFSGDAAADQLKAAPGNGPATRPAGTP